MFIKWRYLLKTLVNLTKKLVNFIKTFFKLTNYNG